MTENIVTESVINPAHVELFKTTKNYADAANKVAADIAAFGADKDTLVKQTLAKSDDEDIVRWRTGEANLAAQIKAAKESLAKAYEVALAKAQANTIVPDLPENFDVAKATEEFLSLRQAANGLRKTLVLMSGGDEKYLAAAYDEMNIVEVVNVKGSGKVLGAPASIKPRLSSATVDGENVEPHTFTNVAKVLKVDGNELREAAKTAAGVDDIRTKHGEEIAFILGGKSVVIVVEKPKTAKDDEKVVETENVETTEVETETPKKK